MRLSSSSVLASVLTLLLWSTIGAGSPTPGPAATFVKALDAYFGEEPYRSIVLLRESMARADTAPLREASLYVLGQSFASIHLYEKAEDSLHGLVREFPNGRFSPVALRELARIFFNLREYGAVVNLDQSYRGTIPDGAFPVEFWYLLGQSNYLLGRKQQAREPLLKVSPGTPFYPFSRFTLGQVEFSLGRPDAALSALADVTASSQAPPLLREKAARVSGMILYQQKRYTESVHVYESIGEESALYGPSRIDLALAAEAAGDSDAARQAFSDAMERADDDLLRTEARVAVGRFLNRQQRAAAARALFEQALGELRARETKLREEVEVDSRFRDVFADLVTFARQSGATPRHQRLNEDLDLLSVTLQSTMGVRYDRTPITGIEKFTPKTYLFPLLRRHYHNPATIETFVDLAVEIEDLQKQLAALEADVREQASIWNQTPPITVGELPEPTNQSLGQVVWLLFANFDLTSRFYDALAVNEKIDVQAAVREKQRALAATTGGLRLTLYGDRRLPSRESVSAMMEGAHQTLESGNLPGLQSQKIRAGFLDEWRSDRDSLGYVIENLDLKERQMTSALAGVLLRSRNVNLPVLTTMTEWLTALQQLTSKYRYLDREREQRPWFLAGRNEEVASLLAAAGNDLTLLRERAVTVLRDQARDLVGKEQFRHSLIVAQAEEGIADALYEERSGRD